MRARGGAGLEQDVEFGELGGVSGGGYGCFGYFLISSLQLWYRHFYEPQLR
jgi:hypothetical protein